MSEVHDFRTKRTQLADDFSWLEEHCRSRPELARHGGRLRLAAALARNVLGGALEHTPSVPLHIAVVGGAGAGKSTVSNLLVGSVVADANPQAGYTRHPTAYVTPNTPWPSYLGFLGPLRLLTTPTPANLDEDVYQRHTVNTRTSDDPLAEFVIWDCPDMTTWASATYVTRLLEVSALADVIVYVASDERYNDEIPTQFLQLLVQAGKAVVVVLTKMKPADAEPLANHFREEVMGKLVDASNLPPVPIVTIPNLTADERRDFTTLAKNHRVGLVNHILSLCPSADAARHRTQHNAMTYLSAASESLLEVGKQDLNEIATWRGLVTSGQQTFEERYRREFLQVDPLRRFDSAKGALLDQLRPSGPLKPLVTALDYLRFPVTYVAHQASSMMRPQILGTVSEKAVLQANLTGWLDALQAESLRRANHHPLWKQLADGFEKDLKQQTQDRFLQAGSKLEVDEGRELEQVGQTLSDGWSKPTQNAIMGGKVAFDLAAIAGTLYLTWLPNWYHLFLFPLVASVSDGVASAVVQAKVETARRGVRSQREGLLRHNITEPLATWLMEWPATGASSVARLQQALQRVPTLLRELAPQVASSQVSHGT